MDAIDGMDDAAAAFFGFHASKPVVEFMKPAYYISSYVGVAAIVVVVVMVLLAQRRVRPAVVVAAAFGLAVAAIELTRWAVPRARPQDAVAFLGPDARYGSYPAAGVLLFIFCVFVLGHAVRNQLSTPWSRAGFVAVAAMMAVWVCMSQFFLGIHYLSDIIGGIAGGVLFGWVALLMMQTGATAEPSA